jgi:putative ABC transport system permease protein
MVRNYIITTLRSFWKNRTHALINIIGLSLGITCTILIFLIIRFEISYDKHHENADRIYRVVTHFEGPNVGYNSGTTYPLAPALRNDFADPEHIVLIDANVGEPVITVTKTNQNVERFKERRLAFVDPEYFRVFTVEWIEGNPTALEAEKTAVVTESVARKYFGDQSAIGKVITYDNKFDVTITGIIKDPPLNTDFPFELLLSSKLGADKRGWDDWGAAASGIQCFLLLKPGVTEASFEAKLKGWHLKYFTGDAREDGERRTFVLQPLHDIHFNTNYFNYGSRAVSDLTLLTLVLIGSVLLLTACVNFINLNTVLIVNRAKEAGVRKVMGSSRRQLVLQFLSETFIITIVSLLISTGLAELAVIHITPIIGYRLSFEPFTDAGTIAFLVIMPIIVTLLSGLYPGLTISRFQPAQALKNRLAGAPGQGLTLRRTLIVFQLVISQVLIVCTVIAVQQMNHFMAQPIGISSEGVVEFPVPDSNAEVARTLRDRLTQIPGVVAASLSNTGATSQSAWGGDAQVIIGDKSVDVNTHVKFADHGFLRTYQIALLYGEDLIDSDTATRFLINEAFANALGLAHPQDALGLSINMWGNKAAVTGIVKNFNTNSLHRGLRPTIIMCGARNYQQGAVRVTTNDLVSTLKKVQDTWESVFPNFVYEQAILDDTIAGFYDGERRNIYLIGMFASVAIFIGCIGLFGMISFMARARTKEIGIRKTLGASVAQVIGLFSKEFIVLISISFVLAAPLGYYFMKGWLENFEYRIEPGLTTFLIGLSTTFVVVIATVGFRSYKAAVANPVDSLRDE